MKSQFYCINLKPLAWKRPELSDNIIFDAEKHQRNAFKLYLEQQHAELPPFQSAVHMNIDFYFPMPKIISKRPDGTTYHTTVPNVEELVHMITDCCQPTLFKDKKIISKLTTSKQYDKKPRTEITITELE